MSRTPNEDYSPSLSPFAMSPDQWMDMLARATPEQRAMAQQYFGQGTAGPSTAPSGTTTANPSTPLETPQRTPRRAIRTPPSSRSSTALRGRRSSGGSSGGGCCGGSGGTDASTPPRERPSPTASARSTPRSRSSRRYDTNITSEGGKFYTIVNGNVVLDNVGQEMKGRIRELCHTVFANDFMTTWTKLDKGKKDRVMNQINDEYKPAQGSEVVPRRWIKDHMVDVMKHWRGDVTRRVKGGGDKPWYITDEDWNAEKEKHEANPQRYKQQEDAAKARMESVGSSHLGSGGWDSFHVYFVSINTYLVCFI